MNETFGYRLKQFALAVDIVDNGTFKQVLELICQYVSRDLKLTYWALLVPSVVNNNPGLQAFDSSTGGNYSFALKTGRDLYAGLAPYAFVNAKKLWVVSSDEQPLGSDKRPLDLWSKTEGLPDYDQPNDVAIRTVILITPLRRKGRTLGVLDLQMEQYHEPTNTATQELELLADSLSDLLVLSETNEMQRGCTRQALTMLRTTLEGGNWLPLTKPPKPQIFVASSHRADRAVMGTIVKVLNSFEDRLRIYYWAQSSESGNINFEVLKQVKASRFGLCYFSEPAEDARGELRYHDNANVIFEAGMFQSLTNPAATDAPTGWIPVREPPNLCPPPPFDFAQQRMIIVGRMADGKPNLDSLQADLIDRIETLLKTV
jgi:hypothetical protein